VEAEALLAATARGTGSAEEAAGAVDAAGSVLPLLEVADVAEMHKNRAIGYSGTEVPRPAWMFGSSERAQYPSPWQVPLTAEQELRNAKTGAARATATAIASSVLPHRHHHPLTSCASRAGDRRNALLQFDPHLREYTDR